MFAYRWASRNTLISNITEPQRGFETSDALWEVDAHTTLSEISNMRLIAETIRTKDGKVYTVNILYALAELSRFKN